MRGAAPRVAALALLLAPTLARAAGGEEGGGGHGWEWFNLVLMLGVLVYFARKPVSSFLAERRSGIERDLQSAEQLLRDAETRLGEWRARAARLEEDVVDIKRVAQEAAQEESARIVADARAVAERIRRDAVSVVERETQRARERLRQETAERAVSAAEKLLREKIQPTDSDRLFDEFVAHIAPGRESH